VLLISKGPAASRLQCCIPGASELSVPYLLCTGTADYSDSSSSWVGCQYSDCRDSSPGQRFPTVLVTRAGADAHPWERPASGHVKRRQGFCGPIYSWGKSVPTQRSMIACHKGDTVRMTSWRERSGVEAQSDKRERVRSVWTTIAHASPTRIQPTNLTVSASSKPPPYLPLISLPIFTAL
jgi:hypothetical protein